MNNHAINIRALIIADISGSITPDEKATLQQLLKEFPEVKALSDHIHQVVGTEKIIADQDMHASVEHIFTLAALQQRRQRVRYMRFASAASLLALCVFAVIYYYLLRPVTDRDVRLTIDGKTWLLSGKQCMLSANGTLYYNNKTAALPGTAKKARARLTVPSGRELTTVLADGSIIHMNSASELEFPVTFETGERSISFSGEAYMEIIPDAAQPFIVHLPDYKVEVLGTDFNVNTYKKGESTTQLLSGKVNLVARNNILKLTPGISATNKGNTFDTVPFDTTQLPRWIRPSITLNNPTSEEIIKAVSRYFGEKLEIHASAEGKHSLLSIDRNETVKEFLDRYAEMHNLETYEKDGVYHLK